MSSAATIFAIDPGQRQSGWVIYADGRPRDKGISSNFEVLRIISENPAELMAVEVFEPRGMPIGLDSVETILWTGRFVQAWKDPAAVLRVYRREVKLHLCGSSRATDSNIRQALLDLVGSQGTKRDPGPTYAVKSHAWAALAVAVTAAAKLGGGT